MTSLPRCAVTGKVTYPSPDAAIRRALISSRKRGVALRYYFCPDCRAGFHLTKQRSFGRRDVDRTGLGAEHANPVRTSATQSSTGVALDIRGGAA